MKTDLNDVKTDRVSYHHGDLRTSLITAGLEIIEEAGPDAFSLRAAARRAGVSPAAPAHHFRDARGLLTAIATRGIVEFGDALERAGGADREATVRAQCHAYLHFALARPGLFRLMWRKDMLDNSDPDHLTAARRVFEICDAVVRPGAGLAEPDDPALAPTIACWSLVHGFVSLIIDGAFFSPETATPADIDQMLDSALGHLTTIQPTTIVSS